MYGSSVLDLYFLSTIFIKFSIWGRRLIYNNYIPFYNKKLTFNGNGLFTLIIVIVCIKKNIGIN